MKFNVILEEKIRKYTTVVVEVESEEELSGILEELDEDAKNYEYNSEDYAAELKKKMKVVEVIEEDGEMTDFECTDYYENQDEDAQD